MTTHSTSPRRAAMLALVLAGLIGVGAALLLAAPARSAAPAFELVVDARLMPPLFWASEGGTFRSAAPFCARGTFVEGEQWFRFTCDDGTGGLTVAFRQDATWRITDGSGNYAGLRGTGSLRGEQLCGPCNFQAPIPWRGTLRGIVDRDAVAPTVSFASATATKLPRPAGAYALKLGIAVRDDVADNPVSYTVRVCAYTVDACAGFYVELARRFGTSRTGAASITMRIRRPVGTRTVRLQLTGEDPLGNAASVSRSLKLPR